MGASPTPHWADGCWWGGLAGEREGSEALRVLREEQERELQRVSFHSV